MNEQIARLIKKLSKIRGNDPISRARKAALLAEIARENLPYVYTGNC